MNFYCIDDDIKFLHKFKETMIRYSFETNIEIRTYTTTVIPELVPENIDAFFLDIEIGTKKIFSFIEKIRRTDYLTPIIIISNYDMYVLNSVKYNIFDFIRKRKLEDEILATLNRLINYSKSILPNVYFKCNDILIKVKIKDIIYVKLLSHKTIIYSKTKEYIVNHDYNHVFKENCNYFIRIHKSYCINPCYLLSIKTDSIVLNNNVSLPLGKKHRQKIIDYYMQKQIIKSI